MTTEQIVKLLNTRGYILEDDCLQESTLSSTTIEKYNNENSRTIVDKESWNYALYNPKKFNEEEILIRLKYKKSIANYLCKIAKQKDTIHYQVFNSFLNDEFQLDYFENNDIKYLVEEISTDLKRITNAVITAVLITNEGIPSDGFWTLADIKSRSKGLEKKVFHNQELEILYNELKDFDCCN